jgi:hypothetical protein
MKTTTLLFLLGFFLAAAVAQGVMDPSFQEDILPDNEGGAPFRGESVSSIAFAAVVPAKKLDPVVDHSPVLRGEIADSHGLLSPADDATAGRQVAKATGIGHGAHQQWHEETAGPSPTPQHSASGNATRRSGSGSHSHSSSGSRSFEDSETVVLPDKNGVPESARSAAGRSSDMGFASWLAVALVMLLAW